MVALWRLYQDQTHHVHLNFGLSLPTGSTTENVTMLSPMGTFMTMRADYGMQLGTGTVDALPGVTYTGHASNWSWGAAWRSRIALDNNDEGYHYGDLHELTGWGGYTWLPGVTATFRAAGSVQGQIHGADPMIAGLMQGTNPAFYGGKRVDLLGGIEIAGGAFGLRNTHFAVEGGAPVYQDLNGPQLGQAWELTLALGVGFSDPMGYRPAARRFMDRRACLGLLSAAPAAVLAWWPRPLPPSTVTAAHPRCPRPVAPSWFLPPRH